MALEGNQAPQAIRMMRLCDAVIPIITSAIAIWTVMACPITEARANEVRTELGRRRGKADLTGAAPDPAAV